MKSTFMTNGNLMVAPYSLQRQSGLKGGIVWPFHAEQLGVPALLHYGPQKNSKKLQKIIGNIINDWLIAENSCNVFYILSSKTFLQTIFLYISKNYNDPLYIAIMSKFGQLSMHACMNQIATLISKNEREV